MLDALQCEDEGNLARKRIRWLLICWEVEDDYLETAKRWRADGAGAGSEKGNEEVVVRANEL